MRTNKEFNLKSAALMSYNEVMDHEYEVHEKTKILKSYLDENAGFFVSAAETLNINPVGFNEMCATQKVATSYCGLPKTHDRHINMGAFDFFNPLASTYIVGYGYHELFSVLYRKQPFEKIKELTPFGRSLYRTLETIRIDAIVGAKYPKFNKWRKRIFAAFDYFGELPWHEVNVSPLDTLLNWILVTGYSCISAEYDLKEEASSWFKKAVAAWGEGYILSHKLIIDTLLKDPKAFDSFYFTGVVLDTLQKLYNQGKSNCISPKAMVVKSKDLFGKTLKQSIGEKEETLCIYNALGDGLDFMNERIPFYNGTVNLLQLLWDKRLSVGDKSLTNGLPEPFNGHWKDTGIDNTVMHEHLWNIWEGSSPAAGFLQAQVKPHLYTDDLQDCFTDRFLRYPRRLDRSSGLAPKSDDEGYEIVILFDNSLSIGRRNLDRLKAVVVRLYEAFTTLPNANVKLCCCPGNTVFGFNLINHDHEAPDEVMHKMLDCEPFGYPTYRQAFIWACSHLTQMKEPKRKLIFTISNSLFTKRDSWLLGLATDRNIETVTVATYGAEFELGEIYDFFTDRPDLETIGRVLKAWSATHSYNAYINYD